MNDLLSIGLLITYQCNIECKHCGLSCSPREKEWMTMAEMKDIAVQSSDSGVTSIALTGGEPTLLRHEELCNYFRFIKNETSINNIRIVTNGHWAKSYDKAYAILKDWKDAGLDELNVSCGEFHQEYIPLQNIGHAYKAGCDLDFATVLLSGEFTKRKHEGKITPYDFEKLLSCRILHQHEISPYISKRHALSCNHAFYYGRGKNHIKKEDVPLIKYRHIPNTCNHTISSLSFHPDGNVTLCCGVGVRDVDFLSIGNWKEESLQTILARSNNDLIANLIRFYGLKSLKEKLITAHPELGLTNKQDYTGQCELCFELFSNEKVLHYLQTKGLELEDELITKKVMHLSTVYSPTYVYE